MAFWIRMWGNFNWRLSVFRSSIHWFHRQKQGEKQNHRWRLVQYNFRDCWQLKFHIWSMSLNSKRGHECAVRLCEVCAWAAHQQATALAFMFKKLLKSEMIKASSQEPEQVTKPGFPVATHKPNSTCFRMWTKQGKSYQTSQHVGDLFLTAGALLVRNLFLHAIQLNCIATGRFCNVWGSKSIENAQNDSRIRNGWFTTNNTLTHTAPSVQQI